jgi:hypothetical protein
MKKIFYLLTPLSVLALVAVLFVRSENEGTAEVKKETEFKNSYKIFPLAKPQSVFFAGVKIPTEEPDIYEKLDRELHVNTYWQSNTILLIKRANKYFPIIEPILKEYGIPDDFKYLAVAESGLQNVVSPAGAKGFWQFMKGTAKQYKMEVSETVDERYHLEKSTRAACKYLLQAKKDLGNADWLTVAASYNMGIAGVKKEQARQQSKHYLDLLLNPETARYVYRITALKYIMKNPKNYGFQIQASDLYKKVPTKKVLVNTGIENLAAWSKQKGINYKILKIHNPWLIDSKLTNKSGKKYYFQLPTSSVYKAKH